MIMYHYDNRPTLFSGLDTLEITLNALLSNGFRYNITISDSGKWVEFRPLLEQKRKHPEYNAYQYLSKIFKNSKYFKHHTIQYCSETQIVRVYVISEEIHDIKRHEYVIGKYQQL